MSSRLCLASPLATALLLACSSSPSTPGAATDAGHADASEDAARGADAAARIDANGDANGADAGALVDAGETSGGTTNYPPTYTDGVFNLGPVDYAESAFHNACAPSTKYDPRVQSVEGDLLAGLWNGIANVAGDCDACIFVTTGKGKSATLRVVTYGDTTKDSIDVSPQAYAILNSGEDPRSMTWTLTECPDTGPMQYEFQTGSSEYWTSLWVRNARVPLSNVEVMSKNHASWTALTRGSDGTLTDAAGFGNGAFSIRSTGVDGQQVVEMFAWPSAGIAGAFLIGTQNFK
jgi:hypothetical protein